MGLFTRKPAAAALTAAAETINLDDRNAASRIKKRQAEWQNKAWGFYDTIPELWFAENYLANALRRIRIYPAVQPNPLEAPIPLDPETDGALAVRGFAELDRLRGEDGSHGEILHDLAMQLGIAGEGMLVGDIDPDTGETFEIYAMDELFFKGGSWRVKDGPEDRDGRPLSDQALVNRIWRQHPRWRDYADSGIRSSIEICEDLLMHQHWSRSASRTRLNAGAMFIPSEAGFKPLTGQGSGQYGQIEGISPLLASMLDAFVTPINNEGSATAVVPALFEMKGDLIDKIKHMEFGRDYDDTAAARETALLRRMAAGVDLPSELILGMADLNHWTAWQVDEDSYKAHIEPLLTLMVNGLTKAFLRPATVDLSERLIVWFDPSGLIANPNRTALLKDAHAAIVISDDAYRRYGGFTDDDAPSDEEKEERKSQAQATTPGVPGGGAVGAPAATEDANANPGPPDAEASIVADGSGGADPKAFELWRSPEP